MIKIDCTGCIRCCGPELAPVLLPSEEKRFEKHSKEINTPYRKMHLLQKKANGNCLFLDDSTMKCTVYDRRPLECQIYPFLLNFESGLSNVLLDERFRSHLSTLKSDKDKIINRVRTENFTQNWIKGYNALTDC